MKSENIDLIRELWYRKEFLNDSSCSISLKQWLIDGDYYINSEGNMFSLYVMDKENMVSVMSYDAFKFLLHAAQTFNEAESEGAYRAASSWKVIKLYYAAYFSAHATLRLFGKSFNYLEPGHVNFLGERARTEAGFNPRLKSGNYLASFDFERGDLSFEHFNDSHKDLWRNYSDLLAEMASNSLSLRAPDRRRQELSGYFSSMLSALRHGGSCPLGNWLSVFRNEVNYKSMHGVWYPFPKHAPTINHLMSSAKRWRVAEVDCGDPLLSASEVERFFLTCFQVFDLAISISLDLSKMLDKKDRRIFDFKRMLNESAVA